MGEGEESSEEEAQEDEEGGPREEVVPISVRFRRAYIERAARVRERDAKVRVRQEVKQLKHSAVAAAVARWMDDF